MKAKNFLFATALSMLAFTACNNDDDVGGGDSKTALRFTSTIADLNNSSPQTRASGATWDANDAIGVYMVGNGQGLSTASVLAQNKHYITENGTTNGVFAPADINAIVNYPEDESKVDFISYYPYKVSIADYKYPVDVSIQTSQPAIDLLYSNNAKGLNKNTPNVSLAFKHKLSKIGFIISSEDIPDLSGLSITIKGTKTRAAFDLAGVDNALVLDESSVGDIKAHTAATGSVAEAIVIPDAITEGVFVFTLPSGKTYSWAIPASTNYTEGKKYTYNVVLPRAGSVQIDPNNTIIEDWKNTPSETIVPNENEDEEGPGPIVGNVELDRLYGYGEGTTGGAGGATYHFNDGKKFRDWLKLREKNKSTEPAIIWLSGTFTKDDGRAAGSPWFDVKRTSNLSIYGVNNFKMENVGFFLNEANNIIIRNIYIQQPKADGGADAISMQKSNQVWIDHCTFESMNQVKDYEDGSCDVTHGTKNVTVSWCHFIKTQKSCLVGHSDGNGSEDKSITATFHHNFFDTSSSRHPRVRFGTVHVYNNFFNKVSTYGVGSAYGAMVLVENNTFDGVHLPTDICTYPAKSSGSNLNGSVAGFLYAADNEYTNLPANASNPYPFTNVEFTSYQGSTLAQPLTRADFTPAYSYIVDKAEDVSTIVPSGAGANKLPNYGQAPVEVDNGNMPEPGGETGGETEEPGGEEGTPLGGGWSAKDIGAAGGTSTVGSNNSSITLTGKGKFEGGAQTFNFVYKEVTGDFEVTAQLDSYVTSGTSNQAEAGILFGTDINATANDFLFALSAKGGNSMYNYSHRLATGSAAARGTIGSADNSAVILKLKRVGNAYYASYSLDGGITYGAEKSGTFTALPETLYLGLIVNSASNTETATAKFSNITINGSSAIFAD